MNRDEENQWALRLLTATEKNTCQSLEEAELMYVTSVLLQHDLKEQSARWFQLSMNWFNQHQHDRPSVSDVLDKHQLSLSRWKDFMLSKEKYLHYTL